MNNAHTDPSHQILIHDGLIVQSIVQAINWILHRRELNQAKKQQWKLEIKLFQAFKQSLDLDNSV